jgi:hypothetical protein
LLIKYAVVIMLPAILGTIHMLSIIFTNGSSRKDLLSFSAFLFYITISYTLYSIGILLRILYINSTHKSN